MLQGGLTCSITGGTTSRRSLARLVSTRCGVSRVPFGPTNRIAKAYVENVFIWNAWPILYGGFGALLSAVQMGQVGQILNQSNFLGGLGNLEGSFLIGAASIIYSLAIAVIPFIAKRIVSGIVRRTPAAITAT